MATIDVKTSITAPSEIKVALVRADHAGTSNVFRVCFEVFLSLFSTLLGYVLSLSTVLLVHWLFLMVCGAGAVAFLSLSLYFTHEAKKV